MIILLIKFTIFQTVSLRQLIEKCKPSNLPDITADSEAHIAMALDAAWTYSGGDWGALLTLIQEDLAVAVRTFICLEL